LKFSLIKEGAFPGGEGGLSSVKYKVISLLPYVPAAMMNVTMEKGFWYCCFDYIIIWKKSL